MSSINQDFVANLSIKMFADGADLSEIEKLNNNPVVSGFTTNPTLMRKSGVSDYIKFANEAAELVYPKPISLEVFADEFKEMETQARLIQSISENVYVKIPITNTRGQSSTDLVSTLSNDGIKLNITALFTEKQVIECCEAVNTGAASVISVFAGRIADAGVDPVPLMTKFASIVHQVPSAELLWASPREILNLVQANECGADIITMTSDLWNKMSSLGKSLEEFSLDTVKMFYDDAVMSGFKLSQ
jgi:transaldolase